jgi:hypothetical protein
MIPAAVIHQAANLHRTPLSLSTGSQITSSIVMPGFVAPGIRRGIYHRK